MFKRIFVALAVMVFAVVGLSFNAASGCSQHNNGINAKQCGLVTPPTSGQQEDRQVTVNGDTSTLGNNFYCYTTSQSRPGHRHLDFLGTCGGGTPRVYLQFNGGGACNPGENTFDSGVCTPNADGTGGTSPTRS